MSHLPTAAWRTHRSHGQVCTAFWHLAPTPSTCHNNKVGSAPSGAPRGEGLGRAKVMHFWALTIQCHQKQLLLLLIPPQRAAVGLKETRESLRKGENVSVNP